MPHDAPLRTLLVALPETAGSALYGMVDVLSATGSVWETLTGHGTGRRVFDVGIVSSTREPFRCGHGIPVVPEVAIGDAPEATIVIVPELWLGPDEALDGRYPALYQWIRERHRHGAWIYSACSGTVLLAETGLLNGCDATSHWAYENLFRRRFPRVRFRPEPNLAFADPGGRVVTAGGTSSWHDLALHVIARHAGPEDALRVAKVYLLKWHAEGQLPFTMLVRRSRTPTPLSDVANNGWPSISGRPTRCRAASRKRASRSDRLNAASARRPVATLIERVQDLRVERAKSLLERSGLPVDEVSVAAGYEDASFFRRLFRRRVGVAPAQYRRMFAPVAGSDSGDLHERKSLGQIERTGV